MIDFIEKYDEYLDDLTVWQAACILTCTDATVRRYLRERKLSHFRTGKGYLIPKKELRSFIVKTMVNSDD